ncbi:MAG: hypothetical protein ACK5JU_07945 [Bacteroidales bacterium]
MRMLIIIIYVSLGLLSCQTKQKVVSEVKSAERVEVKTDIRQTDRERIKEIAEEIAQRVTNEELEIDLTITKFDTDKPADSTSGRSPVLEETKARIKRNKNTNQSTQATKQTDTEKEQTIEDQSKVDRSASIESMERKETGLALWQKILIAIGSITVVSIIAWIIIKFRK